MIRSIFNIIKVPSKFDSKFAEDSVKNNDFRFPFFSIFYFMTVDLIPAGFQIVAVKFAVNQNDKVWKNTPKNINRTPDTTALTYKSASVHKSQSFLKSTTSKR